MTTQITLLKNRTLELGQMVKVYYNLHKKCFSIKDIKTGLVVAHGNNFSIFNPEFKVSEKGRQRVLREKKKNVHAYVIGMYSGTTYQYLDSLENIHYNPYTVNRFNVNGIDANAFNFTAVNLVDKTMTAGYQLPL